MNNLAVQNSSAFLSVARKRIFSEERKKVAGAGVRKRFFSRSGRRVAPFVKIFPDRKSSMFVGKIVGIGTHGGSSAKQQYPTPPPETKTCRPEIHPGCKTSRRLSLNPATSTRGVNRRRRGRGKFSVLPELLSRKSFLSHFSPPTSFPPPLFRPAIRGFRRLRETCSIPGREYDTTGARLVSETPRGRRAQECFLPSASCRLSSHLSLSLLPLFSSNEKRNGGCWLVSSSLSLSPIPLFLFFLLLLRISNASR